MGKGLGLRMDPGHDAQRLRTAPFHGAQVLRTYRTGVAGNRCRFELSGQRQPGKTRADDSRGLTVENHPYHGASVTHTTLSEGEEGE
jgi:hypothetical protein